MSCPYCNIVSKCRHHLSGREFLDRFDEYRDSMDRYRAMNELAARFAASLDEIDRLKHGLNRVVDILCQEDRPDG